MENDNLRNIKYSASDNLKFDKVADRLGRSKRQVLSQMIEYFFRTKKDPADFNDDLLKNILLKNHKEYIGFIKVQEMDLLVPIKSSTERMIRNQEQIVKFFNEYVLISNKDMANKFDKQLERLSESHQLIKVIHDNLESRKKLKFKFNSIFNTYVKNREALGAFKAKEKEDLFEQTLKLIEDL